MHLDVPDGVLVRSRAGAFSWLGTGGTPPSAVPDLGAFAMPVFRSLVPAGEPEIRVGADIGAEDAHINVGLFNAGVVEAAVTIEVRAGCDDSLIDRRLVGVAAGTAEQFSGLGGLPQNCPETVVNAWSRYVTATADQPMLSYVANVWNEATCFPRIPYSAAAE